MSTKRVANCKISLIWTLTNAHGLSLTKSYQNVFTQASHINGANVSQIKEKTNHENGKELLYSQASNVTKWITIEAKGLLAIGAPSMI